MTQNSSMRTLDLKEAAAFLKIHPVTLSVKASTGEIQGAKVGKCWVFLEVDLVAHIRAQYKVRALRGVHEKEKLCHSINVKTLLHGGLNSPSEEKQYKNLLGLTTKSQPKNSMTS